MKVNYRSDNFVWNYSPVDINHIESIEEKTMSKYYYHAEFSMSIGEIDDGDEKIYRIQSVPSEGIEFKVTENKFSNPDVLFEQTMSIDEVENLIKCLEGCVRNSKIVEKED